MAPTEIGVRCLVMAISILILVRCFVCGPVKALTVIRRERKVWGRMEGVQTSQLIFLVEPSALLTPDWDKKRTGPVKVNTQRRHLFG